MEKLWSDLPVIFWFLVSRPKMAELAIEMEKLTFKLSDLQKGRCHISVVDTPQTQEQSPTLKSDAKKKQLKVDKGHNREIS